MTSRSEVGRIALPEFPVDQAAVRQIIAAVDQATVGQRRIDIAHALLSIVGTEIARNAPTAAVAKSRGMVVARQLKDFVRAKFGERLAREAIADAARAQGEIAARQPEEARHG